MVQVNIIAALGAETRAIGKENDLLWKIPGDLPRFKRLTTGHPIIMGERTFASIGRPLPGRTNIVLTHDTQFAPPGVLIAHSLEEALRKAEAEDEEVFVIGGGQVYAQALPVADRLYLTLVHDGAEGDTFFPAYDISRYTEIEREEHLDLDPPHTYTVLERNHV
jgi:dihydrofolate reductase